jgi:hypothetical protein
MKKNYFYFAMLISLMLSSQFLSAQDIISSPDFNGDVSRSTAVFDCPIPNVFCYAPENSTTGYTSDETTGFKCYQSFSGASGSFSTVTVWGVHTSTPSGDRELLVEIYEAGNTPGNIISTTTATVTPVSTGELIIGFPVYLYTISLPTTLSITEGWVSVQATNGGTPTFYWVNTLASPSFPAYQTGPAPLNPEGLAMSLGGETAQVPISNWAILIGIMLIGAFIVVRYRRSIIA